MEPLQASPEYNQIEFRKVYLSSVSHMNRRSEWPDDLLWVLDAIDLRTGAPYWVILADRNVVWFSRDFETMTNPKMWGRWDATWSLLRDLVARKAAAKDGPSP